MAIKAKYPEMRAFAFELIHLDCGRILLWAPGQTSDVDELEKEVNMIDEAVRAIEDKSYQDSKDSIQMLTDLDARTVFADAIAIVLENSLPTDLVGSDKLTRIAELETASKFLVALQARSTILGGLSAQNLTPLPLQR